MPKPNTYKPGDPEYDFWNDKNLYPSLRHDDVASNARQHYDPLAYSPSTLATMVGGSIALTLFGWCFIGLILFLFWISGHSESFLFSLIFQISLWTGLGFIVIMSIAGIVMAIIEKCKKHSD